ncbi:MAG: hypothetical protein ACK2U9_19975 [Anaerolineae bacterium]
MSLALTVPILALSPTLQGWLGFSLEVPDQMPIHLGLAAAVYLYGGWSLLSGLVDGSCVETRAYPFARKHKVAAACSGPDAFAGCESRNSPSLWAAQQRTDRPEMESRKPGGRSF